VTFAPRQPRNGRHHDIIRCKTVCLSNGSAAGAIAKPEFRHAKRDRFDSLRIDGKALLE
jgi:hypothetical protein